MTYTIVGLPGDGIGPEVFEAMQKVLAATGVPIQWKIADLAGRNGRLNRLAVDLVDEYGIAIKGPTGTPSGEGHRSYNVQLREEFQLFANVRPVRTLPGLKKPGMRDDVDIVVFRENLEDLYSGIEFRIPGGAIAISVITDSGTRRIAGFAADYMKKHGRKQAVVGAKSNILKLTHGLFRDVALRTLKRRGIEAWHEIPDALQARMNTSPEQMDCIVLPNFLGDLMSDLCATYMGGLGVAPGANYGEGTAVFEAVHGTAPDIAGEGKANPTALILSSALMLEHLGEDVAAKKVRDAVDAVYVAGEYLTGDVAPKGAAAVSTSVFTEAVCAQIAGAVVEPA